MTEQQPENPEMISSSHIANSESTSDFQPVSSVSLGELTTSGQYHGTHQQLRRHGGNRQPQSNSKTTENESQHDSDPTPNDGDNEYAVLTSDNEIGRSDCGTASTVCDFANTILDPNVDIASIIPSTSGSTGGSLSLQNSSLGIRTKDALKRSATRRQDWRADAVSTLVKDPIVPYKDLLDQIRTNYKLKELKEEDYIGCLETIIERDYFPDLVKLRMTNLLMEAETRGDTATAAVVRKRLDEYNNQQELNVNLKTLGNENVSINIGKGG